MYISLIDLTAFTLGGCVVAAAAVAPLNTALAQQHPTRSERMIVMQLDPTLSRDDIELSETLITEEQLRQRFGSGVTSGEAPGGGALSGCVVMTQSALDALVAEATCGGASGTSNPLEDALEPQVDEPDSTGPRSDDDDDEFDAQGQVSDLRNETGPGYYAAVLVVSLDADMEPVGVTVGGCMSQSCDTADGVFASESEDVVAMPQVVITNEDAEPDAIDQAIERAVAEMFVPILANAEDESTTDDTETDTEEPDSQTPRFDDDGDVPQGCEEGLEAQLEPGAADPIDPADGDLDGGDPLTIGCFASARVFDAINTCRQDLAARPGESGWTACGDLSGGDGGFVIPILTRNDLVTDPAQGDDVEVDGAPVGVDPGRPSVELNAPMIRITPGPAGSEPAARR